jgi:hypothetical protein
VFEFSKGSHPKVSHNKCYKLICEEASATIEYQEGYLKDGAFQPIGVASFMIDGDDYRYLIGAIQAAGDATAAIDDFMVEYLKDKKLSKEARFVLEEGEVAPIITGTRSIDKPPRLNIHGIA